MTGRERCEFLRNIRKNIAELNDLDYKPYECTHEGWCPGYCPLCDAESSDLMRQLEKNEAAGATVKIDVESIKRLEDMAKEPEDIDDDNEYPGDKLMGDVIPPEEDEISGNMPDPDEVMMPAGLPAPSDEK